MKEIQTPKPKQQILNKTNKQTKKKLIKMTGLQPVFLSVFFFSKTILIPQSCQILNFIWSNDVYLFIFTICVTITLLSVFVSNIAVIYCLLLELQERKP